MQIEVLNVQNVPQSLNGYPVTMATPHENGYVTVMMTRTGHVQPYVVATYWPDLGSTWMWGTYEDSPERAMDHYLAISKRNAGRAPH